MNTEEVIFYKCGNCQTKWWDKAKGEECCICKTCKKPKNEKSGTVPPKLIASTASTGLGVISCAILAS